MPCGVCDLSLHRSCAEEIIRRDRHASNRTAAFVVECVECRREVDIFDIVDVDASREASTSVVAFGGTECVVPRRIPHGDGEGHVSSYENEPLEEYVRHMAANGEGSPVDIIRQLGSDVCHMEWPPYSPPSGWGECVNAFRNSALRLASLRPRHPHEVLPDNSARDAIERHPGAYEVLRQWQRRVHAWADRLRAGRASEGQEEEFPPFPRGPWMDHGEVIGLGGPPDDQVRFIVLLLSLF